MQPLRLFRPHELSQASAAIREQPGQVVLRAGGVDLIDLMKEGLEQPHTLVELRNLQGEQAEGMRRIKQQETAWEIGSLVTLGQLEHYSTWPLSYHALKQAASSAATPSIRNLATVGGNLLQRPRCWYFRNASLMCLKKGGNACLARDGENRYHAIFAGGPCWIVHPSTLACALLALSAQVEIFSHQDVFFWPLENVFVSPKEDPTRESRLAPGQILTRIHLPAPTSAGRSIYLASKEKQSHDWPLAEVAVYLKFQAGVIASPRIIFGHVAPIPWRATAAEAVLDGQSASSDLFAQTAKAATSEAKPLRDNGYKIPLIQGLLREALHLLCEIPLPI